MSVDANKIDSKIGERISNLRTTQGVSMNRLAKTAGVTQPFISGIEKGEKSPSIKVLLNICNALGVTLTEFFSGLEDSNLVASETGRPPEYKRICTVARMLDNQELKIVLQLIDKLVEKNNHRNIYR